MKVLIVDDSNAMRMIIIRTLKKAGLDDHDFVQASSGVEGLEIVEKEEVGLILSDWNMPEMNGIDFLQKLRENGNKTTFGFITSQSDTDTAQAARESGAEFVITKPFTAESFSSILSPLLT